MQTEVLMKRQLFDGEVKQKSKTEFLSSTDLVRLGIEKAKKTLNV